MSRDGTQVIGSWEASYWEGFDWLKLWPSHTSWEVSRDGEAQSHGSHSSAPGRWISHPGSVGVVVLCGIYVGSKTCHGERLDATFFSVGTVGVVMC